MQKPSLGDLARLFLKLGVTAYGGLAMVEPMRRRVVQERSWLSQEEFLDGLALCQMLPGATVVQLAAYVGRRLQGTPGALVAAAGFILPAFFLMLGLSFLYFHFAGLAWLKTVSRGLNAMVIALLLQTMWHLGLAVGRNWLNLLIALLTCLGLGAGANYLLVFLAAATLSLAVEKFFYPGETAPRPASAPAGPGVRWALAQGLATLAVTAALVLGLKHWDYVLGQMALIFLKIGAISFGGGYVMIPILQWEVVDHWHWLTVRQFLDGILLSYVTPGPLIILSTFVGYWVKGLAGAVTATIGIFLPPIVFVLYLFPFYQRLKEARWMRPVLQGILAALVGMLALVTWQMGRTALTDLKDLALMAAAATALLGLKIDLIWVAAATAALSLLIY